MTKFCVFCGQSPQEKNKEHVLPQWLIEMTGDPKRIANFGFYFQEPFGIRKFAFDSLVFPACSTCNSRFGKLEDTAKAIFVRLLSFQTLSSIDFIVLLDWLDKVRVGLWLGYLYLDKNPLGINPSFYIESRIGRSDRAVAIVKTEDQGIGVTFVGPQFKAYQLSPTCFALRVNNLWLVNAAGVSLCSQRLGFPYLEPFRLNDDHKLEVSLRSGSGRTMNPVERRAQLPNSVSLYQPVFYSFHEIEGGEEFLETDWVRDHTANSKLGYGKLFIQKQGSVQGFPDETSLEWIPSAHWRRREVLDYMPRYVHRHIHQDPDKAVELTSSQKSRKELRIQVSMTTMVDRAILRKARQTMTETTKLITS
jgi:hypothetical protein